MNSIVIVKLKTGSLFPWKEAWQNLSMDNNYPELSMENEVNIHSRIFIFLHGVRIQFYMDNSSMQVFHGTH